MGRWATLIGFLLLVVGGGLGIGAMTAPGAWYAQLAKPSFNPPGWIFAPVWAVLYVMVAVAGWRVYQRDRHARAMHLWWAQLLLNFAWSPAFFAAHRIGLALAIVALMLLTIVLFMVNVRALDRAALWLFLPYAGWVSFATLLNGSILMLN